MEKSSRPPIYYPPIQSTLVFSYRIDPSHWVCLCHDRYGAQLGDRFTWLVEMTSAKGGISFSKWYTTVEEALENVEELE